MMKTLKKHCYHVLALAVMGIAISCEKSDSDTSGDYSDVAPANVRLEDFSDNSLTIAWDRLEGATSYTIQLLSSKESEQPLDAYTTTSKDFHRFERLMDSEDYYVRVRANFDYSPSGWAYLLNGEVPARIIPAYGIVSENFRIPTLYPNFPEGWEDHPDPDNRKRTYAGTMDTYPSGEWLMPNMYTHNAGPIINKVGNWAVMMRNNVATQLEMNFDLPNGASRLTFVYAAATITNNNEILGLPIALTVEYSQDGGATWTQIGDELLIEDMHEQYHAAFDLEIEGPVRFRIGKNDSRGRPIIDEIAVYY